MSNKVNILDVEFDKQTKAETIDLLASRLKDHKKTFIVTANPEIVMYAQRDSDYMATLRAADYIIPDGAGIIMGAKLLKRPLPERVAGFDLLKDLLAVANCEYLNVFFLGAKEDVVRKAVTNVKQEYPNLHVCGYHHGYFDEKDEKVAEIVKKAEPDLVFVALGFPKQERWIKIHFPQFHKGVFMGVGGSFDVLAGEVKRAPLIWRKLNLEWLYRLIKQPSRWKRMAFLPLFMLKVFQTKKERVNG
ncbi:glycosyltransferase [Pueribacillus theae]|uniref:N-acetylglucosaminyldiphosphoundecaprenol N-acetyl-beta-D-mannosaminyltransferase n=1 Tax=Pueribacillus theae TaxID=2171751 RepID=A0A2U1K6N8_9BACI|nr:WecB/TagA/CpsF family glycosyltransferase [Pueribacillus theae]PWA12874.1 glycosyltransferase [Pueribacillus theae]